MARRLLLLSVLTLASGCWDEATVLEACVDAGRCEARPDAGGAADGGDAGAGDGGAADAGAPDGG